MRCPRCATALLHEKERQGITIDVCEGCRGVWLDRGELEKLTVRAHQELVELDARERSAGGRFDEGPGARGRARSGGDRYRGDDDEDDFDADGRRGPRRRRGFLESLGELFD